MLLFSANVLATSILIAGLAGIYFTGDPVKFPDYTWLETIYIIMQNLETLAYTLGASAPGVQNPFPTCLHHLYIDQLTSVKVLYRAIVGKSGSTGSSDRGKEWKLRSYKSSEGSGGTTLTNNTATWSYKTSRMGSIFKPAPTYPPTAQDGRRGDFDMASPDSPHLYNDKARLTSG